MRKKEERLEVYSDIEEHVDGTIAYENVQFFIRSLAILIIFGNFIAIGYIFMIEPSQLPFSYLTCCTFICAASLALNFVLMMLDLFKEEKLVTSFFHSALEIEMENDWIPKIYFELKDHKNRRYAAMEKKVHFYSDIGRDLIFTAAIVVLYNFISLRADWWSYVILIVITIVFTLAYSWILRRVFTITETINELMLSSKEDKNGR